MIMKRVISIPPQTNSSKINVLTSELATCRTDEQTSMNQITQFVVAGWTILTAVFAFGELSRSNENLITQLILFWITTTILCVEGALVISAGMDGILRHHYLIHLEDMISDDISKNDKRESDEMHRVLLWISLSTAVDTLNYNSVKRYHTKDFFICKAIEIGALVITGLFFICIQIYKLNAANQTFIVQCAILIPAVILLGIALYGIITYRHLTRYSKEYYIKARSIGIQKWKERVELVSIKKDCEPQYVNKETSTTESTPRIILKIIIYFIYPRIRDIQKMVFLIAGYIMGWLLMVCNENTGLRSFDFKTLLLSLIITEALVYQARYQWNDIRGLHEDIKEGREAVRIPVGFPKLLHKKHYSQLIVISLIILSAKLYLAFNTFMPCYGENQHLLSGCNMSMLILALLYEQARSSKKGGWLVLVLVGFGYPLRFITGLFAAYPKMWSILKLDATIACLHAKFGLILDQIVKLFSIGGILQQLTRLNEVMLLIIVSLTTFAISFIAVGLVLSLCNNLDSTVHLRQHYVILARMWLQSSGNTRKKEKSNNEGVIIKQLRRKIKKIGIYPLMPCDHKITWWNGNFTISVLLLSIAQIIVDSSLGSFAITSIPLVFSISCSFFPYKTVKDRKNRRFLDACLIMFCYCIGAFIYIKITYRGGSIGYIYMYLAILQLFYSVMYCSFRNSNYVELYNILPNALAMIKNGVIDLLIGKDTHAMLIYNKKNINPSI